MGKGKGKPRKNNKSDTGREDMRYLLLGLLLCGMLGCAHIKDANVYYGLYHVWVCSHEYKVNMEKATNRRLLYEDCHTLRKLMEDRTHARYMCIKD